MDETTVIYIRDTAATESEDEQREVALEYATDALGLDPKEIVVLSDTALHGRDAPSSSDQQLFELAAEGVIERVIVRDASRIAVNIRDLNDRVRRLVDDGVAVHIVEAGLRLGEHEPDSGGSVADETMLCALDIAADLEETVSSERTREGIAAAQAEGKHVGRPPFGFDSDGDGNLVPNENFETARAVIEQIEAGDSKRSTADDAGITRATVRNILERKELYRSG